MAADVYHPGFLGPGSYAVLLPQDDEPGRPSEREESVASERSDRELTHQHTLSKSMRYQMASDVLSTFRHYNPIRELVLWYNASNEAGVVPAPLQVDAINALESVVDKHNLRSSPPSPQLIEQVLESTSRPFVISQSLDARDLHILTSGENLRFEIIGSLLASAGRSLTFGFAPDLFNDPANRGMKSRFVDELLRASTTCLFLTTMLATVNDITIWLYYENYLFTTMMCGYAGKLRYIAYRIVMDDLISCRSTLMEAHRRIVDANVCSRNPSGEEVRPCSYVAPGNSQKNILFVLQPRQIHFHVPGTPNQDQQEAYRYQSTPRSIGRGNHW